MISDGTILYPDPVYLASVYSPLINSGAVSLYPWQCNFLLDFAKPFDPAKVRRMCLVANNGSGKSAFVVAPCALWIAMRFHKARVVITSASGAQLDKQVGRSLSDIANSVNRIHKSVLWKVRYRHLEFLPTGSVINLFASDEEGKAEGYHPFADSTSKVFAILVDEAKTVSDEIYNALTRMTGATHMVLVSSPGTPSGFLYRAFTSEKWQSYKVTARDCTHIRADEIEAAADQYGEASPIFRSAFLAEFTSVDSNTVISYESVWRVLKNPPAINDDGIARAGIDLATGGDENVMSVFRGNQQVGLECFRFSDTVATRLHLQNLLRKYGDSVGLKGENVSVDDGQVGRAIISELNAQGFKVVPVRFGSKAFNSVAYANRGTELWWNFSRLLSFLRLKNDKLLINQLASRYYKQADRTGKIILESKRESKAAGHSSPDRADGTILAWARVAPTYFQREHKSEKPEVESEFGSVRTGLNLDAIKNAVNIDGNKLDELQEIYRSLRFARAGRDKEAEISACFATFADYKSESRKGWTDWKATTK